jgi:nucleotide-binding universal stress UspA family protein
MSQTAPDIAIRRVLIAHDGSAEGGRAVEAGIDLSLRYGAKATLLTVIHHPGYAGTVGEVQEADEEARQFAGRIQREAIEAGRLRGLDMGAVIMSGHPAEAIVDYARRHDIDIIVMGHRGMSNLQRFFVGSIADRVVDHAPCMVLIAGRRQKEGRAAVQARRPVRPWLTRGVLAIGLASPFSDLGHEAATAVLPLFLVSLGFTGSGTAHRGG